MKQLNLAVKFLLELGALAAFGLWGATVAGVAGAIAFPLVAALLWGTFAAPKARRRLSLRWRAPFELTVFALGALALWASASVVIAVAFTAVAALNAFLLTTFDQWEL